MFIYRPVCKFYVKNTKVPFEEDHFHEFKGHRNLCVEDLPHWCYTSSDKRSRKPISSVLNAFLNTGDGGIVYIGIVDDGTVKAIRLTEYQKDHLRAGIDDLLQNRFYPSVSQHRYRVKFVPVIEKDDDHIDIDHIYNLEISTMTDPKLKEKPHLLRTAQYCWCDKDSIAQFNNGQVCGEYVAEIHIQTWDPSDARNAGSMQTQHKLNPVHQNEEAHVYFRMQASNMRASMHDIRQVTQLQMQSHYQPEINSLQAELQRLQARLSEKDVESMLH
ncbi:PREDICTED: uncharacterized protein LOC106821008 [Priapulus caudatus]|uniref:Uncharacterized protein LOC106821008 n=1 Tax=Priapulus caudatus TaxID=37621 RepID=A0ABM1F9K6_PRICU|nr:PREDICTED: uncharacterized protein LOC106821008 [Priapulus caudatus]